MIRRLVGALVVLVILGGAAATLLYRKTYGTWWHTPAHIAYCESRYYSDFSAVVSRTDILNLESGLPGDTAYPVVTVAKVPPMVGQPLLAAATPESVRRGSHGGPVLPCPMGVYLKVGPDAYHSYTRSGGP